MYEFKFSSSLIEKVLLKKKQTLAGSDDVRLYPSTRRLRQEHFHEFEASLGLQSEFKAS